MATGHSKSKEAIQTNENLFTVTSEMFDKWTILSMLWTEQKGRYQSLQQTECRELSEESRVHFDSARLKSRPGMRITRFGSRSLRFTLLGERKAHVKGVVATPMEKQIAEANVRTRVMAFAVVNNLSVEQRAKRSN
jgi:hypothetical protein